MRSSTMHRSRLVAAALVLACGGSCADSCACGKGGAGAARNTGAAATATPATRASAAAAGRHPDPAGAAGDAGVIMPGAPKSGPGWEPAPPSELTQRLAASKQAIEADELYDRIANDKALGATLHDRLGKLKADKPASSSVRGDDATKLPVVARDYQAGNKSVRVKITDTALMPEARHAVSSRLALVGNAEAGHEHGVFVRGTPALLAELDGGHISKLTALSGGRYLVEIIVRGADKPDEAVHILEQLDLSSLKDQSSPPAKPH
jgi:hypothetical protein